MARWQIQKPSADRRRKPGSCFFLPLLAAGMLFSCISVNPAVEGGRKDTASSESMQPSVSPTSTDRPYPSPTPTSRETPTRTRVRPTNTPSGIPPSYDLPDWTADSSTAVLAFTSIDYRKDRFSLTMQNARTGEEFETPIPSEVCGFFWVDAGRFGLLSQDSRNIHLVSMDSGLVETVRISDDVTSYTLSACRPGDFSFLTLRSSGLSAEGFVLLNPTTADRYSVSGTYSAEYPPTDFGAEGSLQVTENLSGKTVWESSNRDGFLEFHFSWSTVDDTLLAATHGKRDPDFDDFIAKDMRLIIIDAAAGEIVKSLPGPFGHTEWSPDGTRILFLPPRYSYNLYGVAFRDAPCFLSMDSWTIHCLQSIPSAHVPNGFHLVTTGQYHWTADGNAISYIILYGSSDPDLGPASDVCLYHLSDDSVRCPTENLELPSGLTIGYYDFSPDGQFMYFCYANSTILNDYVDKTWDGIIGADGSGYRTWTSTAFQTGGFGCAFQNAWRPVSRH